jgi:hypothetical protein
MYRCHWEEHASFKDRRPADPERGGGSGGLVFYSEPESELAGIGLLLYLDLPCGATPLCP